MYDGSGLVRSYTAFSIHESVLKPRDSPTLAARGWELIPQAIIKYEGVYRIENGVRMLAGVSD
ncbi:hypothetical protein N7533_013755 [Penicillium manginii]|uniref:uncharacterized protein n=1 Tax=Penicillium manginii TaxID=203109 RepID=UPI002546E33B|nr:uncharacterized protein N7533_013755 [Penicillium manginii]KAJ5733308.1 hypothetical protein N7533_013755 [Penicillium manginii]